MSPQPAWVEKLDRGWRWRQPDRVAPSCPTHDWSEWRESVAHFCRVGWIVWQSARCKVCGRIGLREVYRRARRVERILGEISVTDQGAVPESMQSEFRAAAARGEIWQ